MYKYSYLPLYLLQCINFLGATYKHFLAWLGTTRRRIVVGLPLFSLNCNNLLPNVSAAAAAAASVVTSAAVAARSG